MCSAISGGRDISMALKKAALSECDRGQGKPRAARLDRFHITSHLNQALDQVRRAESGRLRAAGHPQAERLKHMRWKLLRRFSRVRGRARATGPAAARQAGDRAGLGAQRPL